MTRYEYTHVETLEINNAHKVHDTFANLLQRCTVLCRARVVICVIPTSEHSYNVGTVIAYRRDAIVV